MWDIADSAFEIAVAQSLKTLIWASVERFVRCRLQVVLSETVSAYTSASRIIAAGLRHGSRRVRENFGAARGRIVSTLGFLGRTTILGIRRAIRVVCLSAVTAWRWSSTLARSVSQTTTARLRLGVHVVRQRVGTASVETISALQSVARRTMTGLGRGGRTLRKRARATWDRALQAARSFVRTVTIGLSRSGRTFRNGAIAASDPTVRAIRWFARTMTIGLGRGGRTLHKRARATWDRTLQAARSFVRTVTIGLSRGGRTFRNGAVAASDRTVRAIGWFARTVTVGLGRGGRTFRKGAIAAWDRTVPAVSWFARAVMVGLRHGSRQFRQRVVAVGKLAVALANWGAVAVAAGVHRGVFFVGEKVAAGRQSFRALDGIAFEVVTGLHGGVRLMLENGEYGIGSTPGADIVLRDPGVMPGHAVLGVQRGRVRLDATGGDVGLGTQIISQGQGCRLGLPLELSLGGASMRLSRIETRAAGRSRFAIAGLAACSVAVVAVVIVGFLREEVKARSSRVATNLPLSESGTGIAAPGREDGSADPDRASVHPVPLIAEAMHELTDRINAANIRTLRVSVVEGRLAVSGALGPQDTPAWSGIQQWFDRTYRGRLVLTTNLGFGEGRTMPALQLRAVWFGERPYVITAEGAHFNQGAILDNGWVIQDIGQDRIVLIKKGEAVTLTYR
jgi:hypothetical protein